MTKNISERLTEIMEEKNITPSELSRRTGIDKSSISRYCSGEYNPGKKNFFRLASALAINPAWLAGEDAPKIHMDPSLIFTEPWEEQWKRNPMSSPFDDLSDEESHLIEAYRKANEQQRRIAFYALKVKEFEEERNK